MSASSTVTCARCRTEYPGTALFCPMCGTAKARDFSGDPLLGTIIGGRYVVQERIGHGASGSIYRAEHTTLRRKAAIKVLHEELSRDDLAIERFRRAATTVGEIDNEHIVGIEDFGRTDDGRLYLAMELLEGETLDAVIASGGPMPVDRVVSVLVQAGEALMEAHAMGYVHRDLRPRNIFLARRRGKDDFVKLLDFGLAKLVEKEGQAASTSLGMTFGDPHYMSPEQAGGDPVDRRTDIYSLGCIAYEMVTGRPPFSADKVFDVLTQHLQTDAPRPRAARPDCPPWLDEAIACALAKRPDERFVTVYRFIEALRQGQESGTTMARARAQRTETVPPASVTATLQRFGKELPPGAASLPEPDELRADPAPPPAAAPPPRADGAPASPAGPIAAGASSPTPVPGSLRAPTPAPVPSAGPGATVKTPMPPAASFAPGSTVRAPTPAARAMNPGSTVKTPMPAAASSAPVGKGARAPDPASVSSSGFSMSQAWYADGEALGAASEAAAAGDSAALRAREQSSTTGLVAYEDDLEGSGRRRLAVAGGVVAAVALLVAVALAVGGGAEPETTAAPELDEPAAPTAGREPSPSPEPSAGSPATGLEKSPVATAEVPPPASDTPSPAPRSDATPAAARRGRSVAREADKPRRSAKRGTSSRGRRVAADARQASPDAPRREPAKEPKAAPPPEPKDQASPAAAGGDEPPAVDVGQAEFYAKLGDKALRNGDVLGAASNFNKARDLNPKSGAAYAGLGEIALTQGHYDDAIVHLRKAARLMPRSARAQTLLGEAFLATGKNKQAATAFRAALKINPDNAVARNGYNEAIAGVDP